MLEISYPVPLQGLNDVIDCNKSLVWTQYFFRAHHIKELVDIEVNQPIYANLID